MDQVRRRAAMDIHSAGSSSICAGNTHASCIGALLLALLALCLYDCVESGACAVRAHVWCLGAKFAPTS